MQGLSNRLSSGGQEKKILLCADDYGQDTSVTAGILKCVEQRKINAVSCFVTHEEWPLAAAALSLHKAECYIGLHLDFTAGKPLSEAWQNRYGNHFPQLGKLMALCYLRQLDKACLRLEIQAQLTSFIQQFGFLPDFIDGHQHIHQFPQISEALLDVYQSNALSCFLRNTINQNDLFSPAVGFPKRQAIALLGGLGFKKKLHQQGIPTNSSFAGIYRFKQSHRYSQFFRYFLSQIKHDGLIMCHPGASSDNQLDPLCRHREEELNYFLGCEYEKDLADHFISLKEKVYM